MIESARVATHVDDPAELMVRALALKDHLGEPSGTAAQRAFADLIGYLAPLLRSTDDPKPFGDLLCLVGRVLGGKPVVSAESTGSRPGRNDLQYFRREGREGPELIESRPGSSKPFHVSSRDFNATLDALVDVGVGKHATFKEVQDAFVKHGGSDTASAYQLRTMLRFLKRATDPALINGIRDGYKVLIDDAKEFKAAALSAMEALGPKPR